MNIPEVLGSEGIPINEELAQRFLRLFKAMGDPIQALNRLSIEAKKVSRTLRASGGLSESAVFNIVSTYNALHQGFQSAYPDFSWSEAPTEIVQQLEDTQFQIERWQQLAIGGGTARVYATDKDKVYLTIPGSGLKFKATGEGTQFRQIGEEEGPPIPSEFLPEGSSGVGSGALVAGLAAAAIAFLAMR